MKDLEEKLMSEFSEGFPWPAFEAAAQKLKVNSSVMLKLLAICNFSTRNAFHVGKLQISNSSAAASSLLHALLRRLQLAMEGFLFDLPVVLSQDRLEPAVMMEDEEAKTAIHQLYTK